jgi:hypothetical protein
MRTVASDADVARSPAKADAIAPGAMVAIRTNATSASREIMKSGVMEFSRTL